MRLRICQLCFDSCGASIHWSELRLVRISDARDRSPASAQECYRRGAGGEDGAATKPPAIAPPDGDTTGSTQEASEIQDDGDENDGADDAHAAACAPTGITVITAASAEQQQKNDE